MKKNLIRILVFAAISVGVNARAGTYANDFNTNPTADPNFGLRGNAAWRATGSHNGSGYISLTDAIGSQQGTIVVPDMNDGFPVASLNLKMKVRIGGGTARPADGLSVNFADPADPVVAGGFGATPAEDGTASGLSVNIDTYDNGNGDGPAMDIKVDGQTIAHKRFAGSGPQTTSQGTACTPVERDAAGNPISLETGDAWTDFELDVSLAGAVTVRYKGMDIFKDVPSGYAVKGNRPGRFVIGARTGNATDNHWIDDLVINTEIVDPAPRLDLALPSGNPAYHVSDNTPIEFLIDASGTFYDLVTSSVRLTVDGTDVTSDPNTTISEDFSVRTTRVTYTPSTPWAAGSKHEAVITYEDNNIPANQGTGRKVFHVTPVVASTPLGNTLFIEAEDFNYWDTNANTAGLFFDFGSANGAYDMRAAKHDVDYHLNVSNGDSPLYRVLSPPNGISVPGGAGDNLRAGVPISIDYKVGWNDTGDWYNYTRTFPNTTYKIYGRFASGGADTHVNLSRVTSDATVGGQTTVSLGSFDADTTAGWDTFCFVPLRDAGGNDVIVRLNGLTTLRVTTLPGNDDFNYLAFVPTFSPTLRPTVVAAEPAPGSQSMRDPKIKAVINDRDTQVAVSSIRLFLDGTELTPVVQTDTASGAEAEYQIPASMSLAAGSSHTAAVVFTDNDAVPVTQTNQWTFTVGPFKGGSGTLFIEAEDFNYSEDGVTGGLHANFGDPDCPLIGKNGVRGVDYFQTSGNDGGAVPAYRPATDVEAAKPGTDGFQRGDHTITCNYIVGWNDLNEWQNYTRDFGTSARYNVYARLSSGGGPENAELARITSDPAAPNQTKEVLGNFSSPATGNWDIFHTVPLRDGSGNLASLRLGGLNTLRFTVGPGNLDFNYLAFVKADVQVVTPTLESVDPRPGSDQSRAPRITAVIKDEDTAVAASSLKLNFDGTDVTALSTITDTAGGATISFQAPERSPYGTTHTVTVSWQDEAGAAGSFTWSYKEGAYNPEKDPQRNLFIEAEDFNTAGGQYIPSTAGQAFNEKGLYNTLGATPDVDYHDAGDGMESNLYRTEGVDNVPHVNMVGTPDHPGGVPRPGFTTVPDYKIGWTDSAGGAGGDWYNYTRDYGTGGLYHVFLRASHGDPAATIGGRLEEVEGATTTAQTTTPLGRFRAPSTAGWDTFTFIPLRTPEGELATVSLSGVKTLRYTLEASAGDFNFLMLSPLLVNRPPTASPLSVSVDQNSSVSFQLPAADPDGDYLQYTVTQPPAKGTVVVNAQTGAATYTVNAGACGTDSFKFKVSDGELESGEETVSITINDKTPPQVSCPGGMTVEVDKPLTFTPPTGNDDCDGAVASTCVRADGKQLSDLYPLGETVVTCTAVDGSGNAAACTFTVTGIPPNEPPNCVAKLTPAECGVTFAAGGKLHAIAVKKDYVCLTLDASASTDPEGAALTIDWVIDTTNLVSGAVVTNCLDVGCHTITLMVSDGSKSCHVFMDLCVITPSEAVEQLILLVENTPVERKNKRPLLVSLKAAKVAFDREGWRRGASMLKVFQHKVRAQIARQNPAEAAMFIQAAENIIDALECIIKTPRKGDDDGDDDDDRVRDDDDNGGAGDGDDDDGGGREQDDD